MLEIFCLITEEMELDLSHRQLEPRLLSQSQLERRDTQGQGITNNQLNLEFMVTVDIIKHWNEELLRMIDSV